MKKLVLTVSTLLAVMTAYSQSNVIVTNSVTGNSNVSSIQQTMQTAYGVNNNASVVIVGNSNNAKLKQNGGGLNGSVTQNGNANMADVTQMGAYGAVVTLQTDLNGGLNKAVLTSNGLGIVAQTNQVADGVGSSNDIKLDQTGNGSYTGIQQNASNGGTNKIDWKQTGYNAAGNQGSQATTLQNADGAGSMNTLMGTQNVGFAPGALTTDLSQNATAGGVNMATVNQSGTYVEANLFQSAAGAGSMNTATFNQGATDMSAT